MKGTDRQTGTDIVRSLGLLFSIFGGGAVSAAFMNLSVSRAVLSSHWRSCRLTTMRIYSVCGGGGHRPPRGEPKRSFSYPLTADHDSSSAPRRNAQIQLLMHLGTFRHGSSYSMWPISYL